MTAVQEEANSVKNGRAVVALVLGILSIVASITILGGIVIGAIALYLGSSANKAHKTTYATVGTVLGGLGVGLSIFWFLVILLAVPTIQRNARNMQRKASAHAVVARITEYQTTHNGVLPSIEEVDVTELSGLKSVANAGDATTDKAIYIQGKNCADQLNEKSFSLRFVLEPNSATCVNNT